MKELVTIKANHEKKFKGLDGSLQQAFEHSYVDSTDALAPTFASSFAALDRLLPNNKVRPSEEPERKSEIKAFVSKMSKIPDDERRFMVGVIRRATKLDPTAETVCIHVDDIRSSMGLSQNRLQKLGAALERYDVGRIDLASVGDFDEPHVMLSNLSDLASRKAALERQNDRASNDAASSTRLTSSVVAPFAELVESVLRQWGFPGVDRVHFDTTIKDLIISGKPRTSYGKGLRAITQSAFTISLLQYCADNNLAHPGLVVLDSPLLSYREPEGADDDLSDTNLNGNFYRYLLGLGSDRQAIIVENMDPPSDVELGDRVIHFSGMVDEGRFGLFPR